MLDVVTSSYDSIDDHSFLYGIRICRFKKAFDALSHNIFLTRLNNYGIRGVAHTLIHSYLNNRPQFVSINQNQSNLKPIKVGVSQQVVTRSYVFSDTHQRSTVHNSLESEPRSFADDTCLSAKGSNYEQLEINLNAELHHLHLWCSVNKLSVIQTKTNIVIIPPKRTKAPFSHLNLSSYGTPVNLVSTANILELSSITNLTFMSKLK